MGRARDVKYFKGKYYQGGLSDSQAESVYTLLTEFDVVNDLKNCIYDIPEFQRNALIDRYLAEEDASGFVKQDFSPIPELERQRGTLRDEQTVGVAFMFYNGSCLLGDSVGMGKTVEISGLINVLRWQAEQADKKFRFAFFSEKTSITQLRNKLIQFTGEYVGLLESGESRVINKYVDSFNNGSDYSIAGTHACITNNAFLQCCAKKPFDLVIIDETQGLRHTNVGFSYDVKALRSVSRNIIFLNATPVELDALDIYNQLDIIDNTLLPTKKEFEHTFIKFAPNGSLGFKAVGYKNTDIFKEAISLRYLARTREDVDGLYEDNEYRVLIVPLTSVQRQLMKKTSLKQLVSDYPAGVMRGIEYSKETCGKVGALLQVLKDSNVKENKAFVYVRFKDCQAQLKSMIEAEGFGCEIINGEVSGKKRAKIIDSANEGNLDVILTNIYRSYDLPTFSHCIFYSIDPNPQNMVQFEGRMTRDIDIVGKRVTMLVSSGDEQRKLETVMQMRVEASKSFCVTGQSMVTEAIANAKDTAEVFKERFDCAELYNSFMSDD